MTTYTPEQIATILAKHKLWWEKKEGGERADLSNADLSYADLSYADLRNADLSNADLRNADLSCADLDFRVISFGPFGTQRQMTVYRPDEDKAWSGCWRGTLAELKAKVVSLFAEGTSDRMLFDAGLTLCDAAVAVYQKSIAANPTPTQPTQTNP